MTMTGSNRVRPGWDRYFMEVAKVVAQRAACVRRAEGAVIVSDNRIISTGYNGTPRGVRNCIDGGCARCADRTVASGDRLDECLCCHAEENAIVQAAYHGVSTKGSTIYATALPCLYCSKMIVNAGIRRVVCGGHYPGKHVLDLLSEANVEVVK